MSQNSKRRPRWRNVLVPPLDSERPPPPGRYSGSRLRNHLRLQFDRYFRETPRPTGRPRQDPDRSRLRTVDLARLLRKGARAARNGTGLLTSRMRAGARAPGTRRGSTVRSCRETCSIPRPHASHDSTSSCRSASSSTSKTRPQTLLALRRLLKPGGRIYTLIPNEIGFMGAVQRRLDRAFARCIWRSMSPKCAPRTSRPVSR